MFKDTQKLFLFTIKYFPTKSKIYSDIIMFQYKISPFSEINPQLQYNIPKHTVKDIPTKLGEFRRVPALALYCLIYM